MGQKIGKWERLSSQIVHQNKFYAIREDQVIKPDGSTGTYHVLHKTGAVIIVAMDEDQEVYLINQHRYTNDRDSWEVPAGGDDGEDALLAAKRELQEETGLTAQTWHKLGEAYPFNGISDELNYFYLATDLQSTGDDHAQEEGITTLERHPLLAVFQMIKEGTITDGQTITAIMLVALHLKLL